MPRPANHPRAGAIGRAPRSGVFDAAEIDELKRLSLLYTPPYLKRPQIKKLEQGTADIPLITKAHRLLEAGDKADLRKTKGERRRLKNPATNERGDALETKIEDLEILITDLSLRIVTLEGG